MCTSDSVAMGCGAVVAMRVARIDDNYETHKDITKALRAVGMETSQLIIGVDFTKSNLDKGEHSFGGRSLHNVRGKEDKGRETKEKRTNNPYQDVLVQIAGQLAEFDADQLFPVYGFGDTVTGSSFLFSFKPNDEPCAGLPEVLSRYAEIARTVNMSGPTSLAPLIRQAIKIVRETDEHNILLIIADGGVTHTEKIATELAIGEASNYALSIVMIGVGDGPWETMERYDDSKVGQRKYDNFQFVNYNTVFKQYVGQPKATAFATHALMEVPSQYWAAKQLGFLNPKREMPPFIPPPFPYGPPDQPNPGDPHYGLLPGWTAVYDSNGSKSFFYMHEETNKRVWGRPVDVEAIMYAETLLPPMKRT